MTDYNDAHAVIAAMRREGQQLQASGRGMPDWAQHVMLDLLENPLLEEVLRSRDAAKMRRSLGTIFRQAFIVGMLAEREGWPVAGDVVRPS